MRDQVPHGGTGVGILAQVLRDRRIDVDASLVGEEPDAGCRQGLGERAAVGGRIRREWHVLRVVRHAEAALVDDLSFARQHDRAAELVCRHQRFHHGIHAGGERLVPAAGAGGDQHRDGRDGRNDPAGNETTRQHPEALLYLDCADQHGQYRQRTHIL